MNKAKFNRWGMGELKSGRRIRLGLLCSTVARMVREDPMFFAVQVSRRAPIRLRSGLARFAALFPPSALQDALFELADIPTESRFEKNRFMQAFRAARGANPGNDATRAARARFLWNRGDFDAALALLPQRSLMRLRYEDKLRVFSGNHRVSWKQTKGLGKRFSGAWFFGAKCREHGICASRDSGRRDSDEAGYDVSLRSDGRQGIEEFSKTNLLPHILHVLVNSSPHTSSGYTVRSNSIMHGQKRVGFEVSAVTRLAYPITVGKLFPRSYDIEAGLIYYRLLPRVLPTLLSERLDLHGAMLAELVEEVRPNILHATTDFINGMVTSAVAESFGIPWVYEMRGQLEKTWVSRFAKQDQERAAQSQHYLLVRQRETQLALAANAVVVLSQVQRADLIARGIPAEKIWVIPNAYSPAGTPIVADSAAARRQLNLPEVFTIGTVTSVVDYEGLETLIEATKILRERGLQARTVIVGNGVAEPALRELVKNGGLEKHVKFVGRVSVSESHLWYKAFDLFALPRKRTLVTEMVTPIKPIEAMANGTPIIASDLPPLRELITDSGAGLAFPPEDAAAMAAAIEELMNDKDKYKRASEAARRNAANLTWDVNTRSYADLYASLLERS